MLVNKVTVMYCDAFKCYQEQYSDFFTQNKKLIFFSFIIEIKKFKYTFSNVSATKQFAVYINVNEGNVK